MLNKHLQCEVRKTVFCLLRIVLASITRVQRRIETSRLAHSSELIYILHVAVLTMGYTMGYDERIR